MDLLSKGAPIPVQLQPSTGLETWNKSSVVFRCSLLVSVEKFLGHEPDPVTLSAVLRRKVPGSWQAAMGSVDHVLSSPPPGPALPEEGLVIPFICYHLNFMTARTA